MRRQRYARPPGLSTEAAAPRRARTASAVSPCTRTRFSRPRGPASTESAAGRIPSAAASSASSSRFAAPSTGRARTRAHKAGPRKPPRPARAAPGRTCTRSDAPPGTGTSQPSGSADTEPGPAERGDPVGELAQALYHHHVQKIDGDHHHHRREIDPAHVHEGQAAADLVEDRLGDPVEEADDGVAWIRAHPREERRDQHDVEVQPEELVQDEGERQRELSEDDRAHRGGQAAASSRARRVAVSTAVMIASRKWCASSAFNPATVVPPGEATISRRSRAESPLSSSIAAAPPSVW